MDEARAAEVMAESASVLRRAGARFAYLHGSRASGQHRPDSDIGVKYTFVTAIEACVDVARHICATEGWGPGT